MCFIIRIPHSKLTGYSTLAAFAKVLKESYDSLALWLIARGNKTRVEACYYGKDYGKGTILVTKEASHRCGMIKNIVYTVRKVKSVSRSILPIMAVHAVFTTALSLGELFMIKFIVNYALSGTFSAKRLLFYIIIYFCAVGGINVFQRIVFGGYLCKFEMKLRNAATPKIYKKACEINLIHFDDSEFYDKLNRAMEESGSRYFIVLTQLYSMIVSILTFLCVFTVYNDLLIICAAAINVVIYMIYYFKENKKKYEFEKREAKYFRFDNYISRIFSSSEYAQELRVSQGMKDKVLDSYAEVSKSYLKNYATYLKAFFYNSVLMRSAGYLLYWIASIYVSGLFLNTRISVGDFLVLINVVSTMSMQIIHVLQTLPDLYKSSLYIDDIKEILDYPTDFHAGGKCLKKEDFNSIEFRDVHFRYSGQNGFALHNVSFTIEKNQIVAVVGLNGSGKSTILNCLLGLLEPDSGKIMLNNVEYGEYDTESLRSIFGAVFQTYQIYEQSVAENILMREVNSKEDMAKVEQALKLTGLYEKVISLKDGINTVISSDSDCVDLSGGERQKIAIARAYARETPVLVFDEPAGALDVDATSSFYSDLFGMHEERPGTIIFTSHRLHYVQQADKIIYLENGSVSETGSHEELMKLGGGYAALYKMQSNEENV